MSDPTPSLTDPDHSPAATPASKKAKGTDWWAEAKGIFWLVLAVLGFHSFIAKPFYIPSESMMPTLITGDRLVVTKYPYGWSYASPSFHPLPFMPGRLLGRLPERGDVVIVTPVDQDTDWIKRVIGLPGDRIALRGGQIVLNGVPVPRRPLAPAMIPVDPNVPCASPSESRFRVTGTDGRDYCRLPRFRETLPNGRSYDTLDQADTIWDDTAEIVVPANHVFLMGDNRDESADSRVPANEGGLGGPVPYEALGGRAEFITFSLDGSSDLLNPLSWFTAMRGGRAGASLHPEESPQAAR